MGAACSQVQKPNASLSRRQSFSALKKQGGAAVLKPDQDFEDGYDLGEAVGDKDENVLTATKKENEVEYVVRSIDKSDMLITDMSQVDEHLISLSQLDHLHICRFVEAFDCNDRLQLVYEKADPMTLFDAEGLASGGQLDESLVQVYARQIAMALSVAHGHEIVHGRLSDTSLLTSLQEAEDGEERAIKVCDIGQTFVLRHARKGPIVYQSPELLWEELEPPTNSAHLRVQMKQLMAVDMWAVGVLLYRMITGKQPFEDTNEDTLRNKIKGSTVAFGPEWQSMPDAREVVHGLLKHSDRIRMTADKVLKHPWVAQGKEMMSKSKMRRVLTNVIYNTTENLFKKFALRVMAEDMSPDKLEICRKAFRAVDKNGDGNLDVSEIREVLRKHRQEEDIADEIFEAIDRDASGTLNFAEFTAVSMGPHEFCDKELLWQTFNRFDRDHNGEFDEAEIARVVREIEHLAEGAYVEKQVEDIAKDIEMPMCFDTFVQIMVTPAGQEVNKSKATFDSCCYKVFKVDNHKVRHLGFKDNNIERAVTKSQLNRSPYSRSG